MRSAIAAVIAAVLLVLTAAAPLSEPRIVRGDYAWLRGRFPDATTADRARWLAVKAWADAKATERTMQVRVELRSLGVEPKALETGCFGDRTCMIVQQADEIAAEVETWQAFEVARQTATPYVAGYRSAVETVRQHLPRLAPEATSLGEQLHTMVVLDQAWRGGLQFDTGKSDIVLDKAGRAVFNLMLWPDAAAQDQTNTPKLKAIVAAQGWPKQSQHGERAARDAFLLAQHADDDPAFQLRVLRLMEPMVPGGDASAKWYGYLEDRVLLRLVGMQRYGTQAECKGGRYVSKPLADARGLDARRKAAGMPPVADYLKNFAATC